MNNTTAKKQYDRPVEIAEHTFWVGFHDQKTNFHCNPYLIVDNDEAVLIDGGSRSDFPVVMMKILQTGISPEQITMLIYQHSDPDLCGSMPNMIDICKNPKLTVLSERDSIVFINYYIEREQQSLLKSINDCGFKYTLGNHVLQFFQTPYAHSNGSFITFDERTKTVFSSDLFGSFSEKWDLYIELDEACYTCKDYRHCMLHKDHCPVFDILDFHRKVMPSEKALRYAMDVFRKLDIETLAPQHGSILKKKKDIAFIIDKLANLKGVGIDAF
jgi:flavorubredoxin